MRLEVKALSRDPLKYLAPKGDVRVTQHNLKPKYHPHEKAREYVRAVNAVKWEKLFAKPFLCALGEHIDTVQCLAKHPTTVSVVAAADCAGAIRLWNLPKRKTDLHIPHAHRGLATGLAFTPDGSAFLSCGKDQTVKLWKSQSSIAPEKIKPQLEFAGDHNFDCISYNDKKPQFVTAGQDLEFWDLTRTRPIHRFNWGDETINHCSYSRTEAHLVLCCMRDRAVCVYDARVQQAAQKMYFENRSNSVTWNPMRPMDFAVCNEDSNVYLMDVRFLHKVKGILKGHVSAVLSADYSPTGRELVSGSFDRTLRIWSLTEWDTGVSRDTYVAKRMARVWTTVWTADNNFIVSGSDDCNVRVWKAYSNKPLKPLRANEARAMEYNDKLKERYKHFPEVARISKQRPVPKTIRKKQRLRGVVAHAEKLREENRARHGQGKAWKAAREAKVLAVVN